MSATASEQPSPAPPARLREGAWAPLRRPVFRALWIATVVSNVGTWMQDVGASWMMTSLAPTPLWVAMVQVATTLPIFLLAIPAGAIADIVDRRRLMLAMQSWMALVAITLGIVTLSGAMTPTALLLLTFAIGVGGALTAPAFQAIVPDLVPRRELVSAISLNSMGFHLARAVGPALGGLVVGLLGPAHNFLLNGASFVGVLLVLRGWKGAARESRLPPEDLLGAMRAGLRYARHAPALRAVLVRAAVFAFGGSVVWALLPLVARQGLGLGPQGYGLLLGCMGVGAVLGALLLPWLRLRLPPDPIVVLASVVAAGSCFGLAHGGSALLVAGLLVPAGAAWISGASTLNACAQSAVPGWVRARAMSLQLLCIFGGIAIGSTVWGSVASHVDVPLALDAAGASLIVGLLAWLPFRLSDGKALDLRPAPSDWTPAFVEDPAPDEGPVLVTVEYHVSPAQAREFVGAMNALRRVRRRDGAIRWSLWRDPAISGRFLESFVVSSWIEHLRQHERVTHADREVQAVVRAFHLGSEPPAVTHYVHARLEEDEATG